MNNATKVDRETILSGMPISDGLAEGNARVLYCISDDTRHGPAISLRQVPEEIARVRHAFQLMLVVIEYSETFLDANVASRHSDIFSMQRVLLEEPAFRERTMAVIKEDGLKAQTAISRVVGEYIQRLSGNKSPMIRDRVSDLIDLKIGLIDALDRPNALLQNSGVSGGARTHAGRIAVTRELTPRFVIEQNMEGTRGILAEHGGRTSHAAILCRALRIPAVSELAGACDLIQDGATVFMDGSHGRVVILPSLDSVHVAPPLPEELVRDAGDTEPTVKDTAMRIMANISFAGDAAEAVAAGAEGIGLYRTEFEFMIAGRLLDENEQFDLYRRVVETMAGRPVYIRLLDIQEDKTLPTLSSPPGGQGLPAAYGARFLLKNGDIFAAQARSMARASCLGPVSVIYPMVLDLNQFLEMKARFNRSLSGQAPGELKHGVMFEVPSACLQADDILREADFGCIGTNDLIQFLFGVDRNRDGDAVKNVSNHPILRDMIAGMARSAGKAGKPLLFCGDLASKPENLGWLAACGIKIISAPCGAIRGLRQVSRKK